MSAADDDDVTRLHEAGKRLEAIARDVTMAPQNDFESCWRAAQRLRIAAFDYVRIVASISPIIADTIGAEAMDDALLLLQENLQGALEDVLPTRPARERLRAQPQFVAWPADRPARYSGGVLCDALHGPCACGAWHDGE